MTTTQSDQKINNKIEQALNIVHINISTTDSTLEVNKPQQQNPRKHSRKQPHEIRQLSATLQLNKLDRILYVPLQFRSYELRTP